jgi:predicted permease
MNFVEPLLRDLRQSVSSLVREKSFTLTVLLIFALCLGANVAIFAVVDSVLLQPLPYREPGRLVAVYNSYPKAGVDHAGASIPHYLERREGVAAFAETAAVRSFGGIIGDAGSPERVEIAAVTPSFFPLLGANAALGRTFTPEEGVFGHHQVVILSDGLWRRRFSADPAVIGQTLRLDTKPYTIVGVMPAGFRYLSQEPKLWMPLAFSDDDRKPDQRHSNNMEMIARLRPGATLAQATAEVDALNARTLQGDPYAKLVVDAGFHTVVQDLRTQFTQDLRPILLLLQAGVLFLLLIGAVNLANLLLVRATGRTKEFSVRQALGASWAQLARALVVETLLLSVAGGLLGLGLGAAALRGIAVLATDQLPLVRALSLDATTCGFALAASLVLGLVLAVPVVWHSLHSDLTLALSAESRGGTTSRQVHQLRHTLIVAQIALAFVLVAGTGLLGLSFTRILAVEPGFRPDHLVTGALSLRGDHYKKSEDRLNFIGKLTDTVRALPGVTSVGVTTDLPFTGSNDNNAISIEGRTLQPGESIQAHFTSGVAGDYFATMGVTLREGRFLNADDSQSKQHVCVIDEAVAHRYWPKGGALGHRLKNGAPDEKTDYSTIVGVVGAVKQNDLADQKANGAIYFPYANYASSSFMIAVRTAQVPESFGPMLRTAVLHLDPELPLNDLKTMAARVDDSLATRRIPFLLAGIFAGVALVLAAVGIYGVLAYSVLQRRREIGVRMALGAQPEQILAQFLGLGGKLLLIGLPFGLLGAWMAGRAMTGLLFGVAPANPLVLGGTAAVLALVTVLACLLPSRRAAKVSPMEALRGN